MLIGGIAATIIYVALQKAKELGQDKTIVVVHPDDGSNTQHPSL